MAESSGGLLFDWLFVFAVCLISMLGLNFGFLFAGLNNIGRGQLLGETDTPEREKKSCRRFEDLASVLKSSGPESELLLLLADMLTIQQTPCH